MKNIYIPIGSNCSVAHFLRENGLRQEAFPFDWGIMPLNSVVSVLENNFEGFLSKDNLYFFSPTNRMLFDDEGQDLVISKELITPVYNKIYHNLFVHDFSAYGAEELDEIRVKYNKRINRLFEVIEDENCKVIFVYTNTDVNSWQTELYKQVNYSFKKLNLKELFILKKIKYVRGMPITFISIRALRIYHLLGKIKVRTLRVFKFNATR